MLLQFNCENFKSYRDEFSLNMSATSIKEHKDHVVEAKRKEKYLKVAAIYGANASGKSNIIEGFDHMKFLVMTSFSEAGKRKIIPLKRFHFNNKSKKTSSTFEVFFSYKENQYQYGFEVDENRVVEEWLYKRDFRGKEKYNLIFERENQKFQLNEKLEDYSAMLKSVDEKTLLLSFLSNVKLEDINNVFRWFYHTKTINFGNPLEDSMLFKVLPNDCFNKNKVSEFENYLKAIDVGIEGIEIEEIPNSSDEDGNPRYKAYSLHKNNDTGEVEKLSLGEESHGTLKMITLYEPIRDALKEGSTLFIDEMDAKLHPLLTKYIIKMFYDRNLNKKNAQLIFTTHDVVNLTKDLFRRDEIWFVEKDKENVSSLFSLAEYKIDDKKVRNDASYNKDYLYGRYGALPILKEFEIGGE